MRNADYDQTGILLQYLQLSFLCGRLTQGKLEWQDGHSRSGQGGGVPGAFTWNTPVRVKTEWVFYQTPVEFFPPGRCVTM